jgi:hypothetical protein
MPGFHKDKQTNKWYCDQCNEEIPFEVITASYNYFGKNNEHICKK